MNKKLIRGVISAVAAFAAYFIGVNVFQCSNDTLYLAMLITGGFCWVGSKE